ncbi:TetR family transcriptional regulator [Mycobacterium syngnathidarum]
MASRPRKSKSAARAPRDALVRSGLELMRARPWTRVSAREIAESAGVEPALVTYYFGGRSGLVVAVAAEAAATLRESMTLDYEIDGDVDDQLFAAVRDPLLVLAREPLLAQLYVAELLLNPDDKTDVILHDMAVPYFDKIQGIVRRATASGVRIDDGRGTLLYALASLALMPWFLEPWLQRAGHPPRGVDDAEKFAAGLTDVVLHGVGARGRRRGNVAAVGGVRSRVGKETLLDAAIVLLRERPNDELTPQRLAAATNSDVAAVRRIFPDQHTLVAAVARAATRQLSALQGASAVADPPGTASDQRKRGRPPAQNPVVERNLLDVALQLLEQNGRAVSARAVASRAGCDPALITYYFGSRNGLYQRLAEEAIAEMVTVYEAGVAAGRSARTRLTSGLTRLVTHVAERPHLAHFILDQCVVHGSTESDAALSVVARPYFDSVNDLSSQLVAEGRFRTLDSVIEPYAMAVLPLFLAAFVPIMHRALRGPIVALEPQDIAAEIIRIMFDGAHTTR